MPNALLPVSLNRKEYVFRCLILFVILMVGMFLWVAALVPYWFFLLWTIAVWIYAAAGLAAPRFRDVGQPPWLAMLVFAPVINLLTLLVLFFLPSKSR